MNIMKSSVLLGNIYISYSKENMVNSKLRILLQWQIYFCNSCLLICLHLCCRFQPYSFDGMICNSSFKKLGWTNKDQSNPSRLQDAMRKASCKCNFEEESYTIVFESQENTRLLIYFLVSVDATCCIRLIYSLCYFGLWGM